jgi:serine/threonine protein kinase
MTTDRWRRVEGLFHAALERPEDVRAAWLAEQDSDPAIRDEVRSLLDALHDQDSPGAAQDSASSSAAESESSAPLPADRFGHYRLIRPLGRGGMGSVYLAERADGAFQMAAAVKLIGLPLETEEFRERFRRERQILAKLNHPNITRLLDGGITGDGQMYIVMEYVDGVPIDRFPASLDRKLEMFRAVCAAVQWAHQNLIVHRDIKPSNILVDREGQVKLLDFGAAKLMGEETMAQTGFAMITPGYASPEQLRGEPATTLSDVFSLGAVLYELVAGEKAFGADLSSRLSGAGGEVKLPRPLAGDLDRVARKALAAAPAERYSSAEQLAEDVRRWQSGEPVIAHPPSIFYRTRRLLRRHWITASLLAALILVLAASSVYTYRQREAARKDEIRANTAMGFYANLLGGGSGTSRNATMGEFIYATARTIDRLPLAAEPQLEATVRFPLASAFEYLGDLPAAQAQVERVRELAARPGASARVRYLEAFASVGLMNLEGKQTQQADAAAWKGYTIARDELSYDRETVLTALMLYLATHRNLLIVEGRAIPAEMAGQYHELVKRGCEISGDDCLVMRSWACLVLVDSPFEDDGLGYCRQFLDDDAKYPHSAEDTIRVYWALAMSAERRNDWKNGLLYRRKHFDLAIATYGASSPQGRFSRSALGRAEFRNGDREGGLARTQAAVEEMVQVGGTPTALIPFFDYADLLSRSGRGAEAEEWVRRGLELMHIPPSRASEEALGEALIVQGKFPEAIQAFERALASARRRNDTAADRRITGYLERARRRELKFE